jgi:hypothetical protein
MIIAHNTRTIWSAGSPVRIWPVTMLASADFQHGLQCRTLCAVVGGAEAVRALQLLSAGGGARRGGLVGDFASVHSDSLAAGCEPWEIQRRGYGEFSGSCTSATCTARQDYSTRQTESLLPHNSALDGRDETSQNHMRAAA